MKNLKNYFEKNVSMNIINALEVMRLTSTIGQLAKESKVTRSVTMCVHVRESISKSSLEKKGNPRRTSTLFLVETICSERHMRFLGI